MTKPVPAPLPWHTLPHAPAPGTLLGQRDDLQDGQVRMHQVFAASDTAQQHPFRVLLLRSGHDVKAFVNRCAHFGVPLASRQDLLQFKPHTSLTCNVHYARYRWSDGVCDRGDCVGEALIAVPLQVDAHGLIRIAAPAPTSPTTPGTTDCPT
jgi:nitrite reductase/ring-hydroxylating ferredoxin subunit